jgi:20S proteasome alpha/beta subunit
MTTIIGDWVNKKLVSDSQFSDDDTGIKYFDEKIVKIDGGWLGVAGNWCDAEKVVDYINKKTKTKPKLNKINKQQQKIPTKFKPTFVKY